MRRRANRNCNLQRPFYGSLSLERHSRSFVLNRIDAPLQTNSCGDWQQFSFGIRKVKAADLMDRST